MARISAKKRASRENALKGRAAKKSRVESTADLNLVEADEGNAMMEMDATSEGKYSSAHEEDGLVLDNSNLSCEEVCRGIFHVPNPGAFVCEQCRMFVRDPVDHLGFFFHLPPR